MVLILTVVILADSGYQGIQDYHKWSLIPIKKSKTRPLSEAEKAYNTELSRRRIVIENINAKIKVLRDFFNQLRRDTAKGIGIVAAPMAPGDFSPHDESRH